MTTNGNGNGRFANIYYMTLLAYLGWVGFEIMSLLSMAGGLPFQTADRYHGADAARDFKLRDEQIHNLDIRLTAVENRQRP